MLVASACRHARLAARGSGGGGVVFGVVAVVVVVVQDDDQASIGASAKWASRLGYLTCGWIGAFPLTAGER